MPQEGTKLQQVASRALPRDVIYHLPRISLLGNLQCCVENHQGILQYTACLVSLQAGKYRIVIAGHDLVITSLDSEAVYIEGRIEQVRYEI